MIELWVIFRLELSFPENLFFPVIVYSETIARREFTWAEQACFHPRWKIRERKRLGR